MMYVSLNAWMHVYSGGKDSCYNMLLCQKHGHEIIALGNLLPAAAGVDELDSYMFQTVGHSVIPLYAECMGIPLYRRHIRGSSIHQVPRYINHINLFKERGPQWLLCILDSSC